MPTSTNTLCSAATSCCVCCRALAIALKRAHGMSRCWYMYLPNVSLTVGNSLLPVGTTGKFTPVS